MIVQLYVQDVEASLPMPHCSYRVSRIRLAPGEKQTIRFTVTAGQLSMVDEAGTWHLEPGDFRVWIGGQQPDLNPIGGVRMEGRAVHGSRSITFTPKSGRSCNASPSV
jgi:hypothetical protein